MDEKITKFIMSAVVVAAILAAIMGASRAQQFTPQQQAAANLGQQIGLLAQNNAELAAQIQTLNQQLIEKDKRIKELEAKTGEKK